MKIEKEEIDETKVTLDAYNSDLNLSIDGSHFSAQPLTFEGFAFMWAGARSTHGGLKGKFCFEVKVLDHLDVSHLPVDEPSPHVVRVGFSVESCSLQLGEDPLSYGYGGTGKISTNCQFKDYGTSFSSGDVVLGVANMDYDFVQLGFAKNGKFLGWAYEFNKSELKGKALYPHVLTKNVSFEVNFGQLEKPFFPMPDGFKDYRFIGCLPLDQKESGTRAPLRKEDCEMIMMCGLPGAGKSVWAEEYSKKNPQKKYNILGTNNIIDKMKVMGLPRKRNYHGRWDVLIQMATKCLNKLFEIGSKLRRNYILDQTNVFPTAQKRKMRNFLGFKRIAVVVVPTDAEYRRRCNKRDKEEGKEVPDHAVLEMKANFKLPEIGDSFDEVIFTDLQHQEAEQLVASYNEEGKAAIGPAHKQFRPNDGPGVGSYKFDQGNAPYSGERGRGGFRGGRGGQRGGFDGSRGGFGGNRGGFDGNRGGFDGNRGGFDGNRGGFDGNRGGFNRNRGGYGNRGGYDGGRGGYDGGRGGYDGGRGGYDGGRGGYDGGRGGYDGGRGGYDGGRGSYNESRGRYEGGRGGFNGNRGGYDGGRGGYEGERGGYDRGRGGYDGGRGGYDGGKGGYDGGRGGYEKNRGGYESSRGGYDRSRGGSDGNRGGLDRNQGSNRSGYESDRKGYEKGSDSQDDFKGNRGGYGGNRGGFESSRGGYDRGRGNFSRGQGGYRESRGNFQAGQKRSFDSDSRLDDGGYGEYNASSGYGDDSRSGNDYSASRSNVSEKYSSQDYNSRSSSNYSMEPALSAYDRGSGRSQRGSFQGNSRNDFNNSREDTSSSRNYGSGGNGNYKPTTIGSSYSRYQSDYTEKPQERYQASSNPYDTRDSFTAGPLGGIKKEPGIEVSNRGARGTTRPSGRASRWSAEPSSYPDTSSSNTIPETSSYSAYGAVVKTEPVSDSTASRYEGYNVASTYASYSSTPSSNQAFQGSQSYGQSGGDSSSQSWMPSSQQWTGPSAVPSVPPVTSQDPQQYYQQQTQPQYYDQYGYGQQATTGYGSGYGAK